MRRVVRRVTARLILTFAIFGITGRAAGAQIVEPIGPFVADARITWVRLREDPAVASVLGVGLVNLPTRGLGFLLGGHWYPLRRGVTVGVGAELLSARASRTLPPTGVSTTAGPTVETRLSAISPQLSLNFGSRNGWSYVSGGIGWAGLTSERVDRPLGEGSRARTVNYGGGARWFTTRRLAVSVDLRFYSIGAQPATISRPAFPKSRLMIISGGVAFR